LRLARVNCTAQLAGMSLSEAVQKAMFGVKIPDSRNEEQIVAATRALQKEAPEVAVPAGEPQRQENHENEAVCAVCKEPIGPLEDAVKRSCRHMSHVRCFVVLARAGRQYCTQCPMPVLNDRDATQSTAGYTVDSGNDTEMRAAVIVALEDRVAKASCTAEAMAKPDRASHAAYRRSTQNKVCARIP